MWVWSVTKILIRPTTVDVLNSRPKQILTEPENESFFVSTGNGDSLASDSIVKHWTNRIAMSDSRKKTLYCTRIWKFSEQHSSCELKFVRHIRKFVVAGINFRSLNKYLQFFFTFEKDLWFWHAYRLKWSSKPGTEPLTGCSVRAWEATDSNPSTGCRRPLHPSVPTQMNASSKLRSRVARKSDRTHSEFMYSTTTEMYKAINTNAIYKTIRGTKIEFSSLICRISTNFRKNKKESVLPTFFEIRKNFGNFSRIIRK